MRQYQEIIKSILSAFKRIPFYVIVESTVGYQVEQYDTRSTEDKLLIDGLCLVADTLTNKYYVENIDEALYRKMKGHKPTNFRNNEAAVLVEEFLSRRSKPCSASFSKLNLWSTSVRRDIQI